MQPLLDVSHYASQDWFDIESSAVFKRVWILAAIGPMLSKHNDFRTLDIAGVPVVLQNNSGDVSAFLNICRHRMATIQNDEFGNRPLTCRYHHWSYDAQGQLQHTHKDPSVFGFTESEKAEIRLREFRTAVVGGLIFVNLADDPMPLEEQFDPAMLALLAAATSRMDSTFVYTRYQAAFNWKTGIENIKDALHVQCLHKATFPEYFDIDVGAVAAAAPSVMAFAPGEVPLSKASTMADVLMQDSPQLPWHSLVEQLDSKGRYRAFQLFPNVNLMIVDGTSFAIQIYNPLAAGKTEMQMMVALTKPVADFPHKPVVLWEHLVSDMRVLQEDIDCLEAIQKNFAAADFDVIHGTYEMPILEFQAAYLSQVRRAGFEAA